MLLKIVHIVAPPDKKCRQVDSTYTVYFKNYTLGQFRFPTPR